MEKFSPLAHSSALSKSICVDVDPVLGSSRMKNEHIKFQFSSKEKGFLQKSGINVVYLFGSRATNTAGPLSDYDFSILLMGHAPLPRKRRNEIYNGLLEIFESKIKKLCNIDIVFLNEASLQLQFQVIGEGEVLYELDAKARADYHAKIMEAYADFLPLQRIFEQATLARI